MYLATLPASQFPYLLLSQANPAFLAALADAIAEYTEILAEVATSHNVRCISVYSCSLPAEQFYLVRSGAIQVARAARDATTSKL
jgi:hypothetical protein